MKSRRTNEEDSAKCHKAKEIHLLLTHTTQTNIHKHFLAASLPISQNNPGGPQP